MSFLLVPTSMTLNDLKLQNIEILALVDAGYKFLYVGSYEMLLLFPNYQISSGSLVSILYFYSEMVQNEINYISHCYAVITRHGSRMPKWINFVTTPLTPVLSALGNIHKNFDEVSIQ